MAEWTEKEVMLLHLGKLVPNHTMKACKAKARSIGITYRKSEKNSPWTAEEDALLNASKIVPNRSLQACHVRACKIGLKHYTPLAPNTGKRISAKLKDMIAERVKKTRCVRETGRIFGVSYSSVMEICRNRGIVVNPSSRDRLGNYIEFEGARYTHTGHGSWRCTTGNRDNLAWIMWNRYHPEDPIKHQHRGMKIEGIIFLNHDYTDFRKSNLAKMDQSEFAKWLESDPRYRAYRYIGGLSGLNEIRRREEEDPELRKIRIGRMMETKRERGTYGKMSRLRTWTEEEMEALRSGDMEPALARHTKGACLRMRHLIKKGMR